MHWTKRVTLITVIFLSAQELSFQGLSAHERMSGENLDAKNRHEAIVVKKVEHESQTSHVAHPIKRAKRAKRAKKKMFLKDSEARELHRKKQKQLSEERQKRQAKYFEEKNRKKQASLKDEFALSPRMRKTLTAEAIEERRLDHTERLQRLRAHALRNENQLKAKAERQELLSRLSAEKRKVSAERKAKIAEQKNHQARKGPSKSVLNSKSVSSIPARKTKGTQTKKGWFWWKSDDSQKMERQEARRVQQELKATSRVLHKQRIKTEHANKLEALALEKKAIKDHQAKIKQNKHSVKKKQRYLSK